MRSEEAGWSVCMHSRQVQTILEGICGSGRGGGMILTLMRWEMLYKILLEILLHVISSFIVSTHNERLHCSSIVRDYDKLETSTRHHPLCP